MSPRPRTSAALLLDQIAVLEEVVGAEIVQQGMAALPPAYREELETLTAVSWVDTEVAESILYAVAPLAGRDPLQLHTDIVRIGVQRTLRTLWRVLLRFTSDRALVLRTPLIYSKTFDRGELLSRIEGPGRAELALSGWPDISEMQLNGLATGVETVLTAAGRRNVKVVYERREEGAFLVASWTP